MARPPAVVEVTNIPIIIVSYRNPEDVSECLQALRKSAPKPGFDVYICENGGSAAFEVLTFTLTKVDGPCTAASTIEMNDGQICRFARVSELKLGGRGARVLVAEAKENFGYAGGINAWIRVLLPVSPWPGVWILNPDTQPEPTALAELVAWSAARGRGMVGCRIVASRSAEYGFNRGLRWRPISASTKAVDRCAPTAIEPDPERLEADLDAPSGAAMYVTRQCLEGIGLMDERYFLFFEDLDWGYRAKYSYGVGYSHKSVVVHCGGTTIGTAASRSKTSPLAVYLDFRNRVGFVRKHHQSWVGWTLLVLFVRSFEYGMAGAFTNQCFALKGIYAGIAGETGRPDNVFDFDSGPPGIRHKQSQIGEKLKPVNSPELSK